MAISFPVGPASVPSDLTQPPATYRRRVALALAGLVLFLLLYLLLTGWLGFTAYRLMAASIQGGTTPSGASSSAPARRSSPSSW
ncbi:MAG TPA: hypothetical protein VGJ18_02735 [Gemmatimonadaceae bacterium]